MFGMEEQSSNKSKQVANFNYELENEIKDPKKKKELEDRVSDTSRKLKAALQVGLEDDDYNNCTCMLQGYIALQKIIGNIKNR